MTNKQSNLEIVDFVKKTTEAITVISEATKGLKETTNALKDMVNAQNTTNAQEFEKLGGKMDGLKTLFVYVIIPLIGGILALVGLKLAFTPPAV